MSLIFEALKKLQDQPVKSNAYQRSSRERQGTQSKHSPFFSPWSIAGMSLCIIIAGLAAIYVLGLFPQQATFQPDTGSIQSKPQPEKRIKIAHPQEEPVFIRSGDDTEPKVEATFMRAASKGPPAGTAQAINAVAAARGPIEIEASTTGGDEKGKQIVTTPPNVSRVTGSETTSLSASQTRASVPARIAQPAHLRKPLPAGGRSQASLIIQKKIDRQARITRLVARIYARMDRGDKEEVQKLMDELAALKGPQNGYVLKLRAYWHLNNEEYSSAMSLLEIVLARDGDDLEAGINMAIAEMKTYQYQAARERLMRLRKTYPDNHLIAELMLKMR